MGEVEVDEGRCVVLHKGLGEDFQSTEERTNPGKGIEKSVQSLIIGRKYLQEQECRQ